jgi:hypothetical protein
MLGICKITIMNNTNFLSAVALIFGAIAIALWTLRLFYEIIMIYPLCCNIVQFMAIAFLYGKTK